MPVRMFVPPAPVLALLRPARPVPIPILLMTFFGDPVTISPSLGIVPLMVIAMVAVVVTVIVLIGPQGPGRGHDRRRPQKSCK